MSSGGRSKWKALRFTSGLEELEGVEPGVLGGIMNVATGELMEEFVLKAPGMLVLANATPCMMAPGGFPYFVGHIKGEAERKLPSR